MFAPMWSPASGPPGAPGRDRGKAALRLHVRTPAAGTGRRLALAAAVLLALTGCSAEQLSTGFMPSDRDITNHTGTVIDLWNGSWIAALAVGVLTWGLTIWCVIAYRRRKDEVGLPAQVRYNLPLELLYTVVPLMMISVLFYFTARDQIYLESRPEPDHRINVVGKQWSWDFNYLDEDVYDAGVQAPLGSGPGVLDTVPALYLPVGERVELELQSRDVIHSFWVVEFLYKKDMIPGRTNYYSFIPEKEGTYTGKCAELCGQYHSEMLFQVRVVDRATYDAHIESLRDAGQTGQLSVDLGPYADPDAEGEPVEGNPFETGPDAENEDGND